MQLVGAGETFDRIRNRNPGGRGIGGIAAGGGVVAAAGGDVSK